MYAAILILLQTLPFGWYVSIRTGVYDSLPFCCSHAEDVEAIPYWANSIRSFALEYDPDYVNKLLKKDKEPSLLRTKPSCPVCGSDSIDHKVWCRLG